MNTNQMIFVGVLLLALLVGLYLWTREQERARLAAASNPLGTIGQGVAGILAGVGQFID